MSQSRRLRVRTIFDSECLLNPLAGYVTRRSYTITLEKNNLDLLEKLIAAALNNGAL